jgi:hypothetical protein
MGIAYWFNAITWGTLAAFAGLNLLVLLAGTDRGTRLRSWARRQLERVSGRRDLDWLDWLTVWVGSVAIFAGVAAYGILSGQYGCHPPSDAIGLLDSGKAFWAGQNPFTVPGCGSQHEIPYGLAAVLLNALGSLGGLAGIYAIWGLVAFSIVPLTWALARDDRRLVLLFVGSSVLLIPLVSSQIDGATNALVPATVLLALYLARRRELLASAIGGFLATARFPNVFPLLGETGAFRRRRYAAFGAVAAVFLGLTGLSYLRWGASFLGPVYLDQIGRRSFSLNFYGVLLFANALPTTLWVEGTQAVLMVALVLVVFWRIRSSVLSAAIVLVGFALLTPFLSYTILVWLLPVALIGVRARWWLWGVALVGSLNYDLALNVWFYDNGISWPSSVLDVVLTVLLLALFVELWREARRGPREAIAA